MSYNVQRAERFLSSSLAKAENKDFMDLSNKIIEKIFTTISDRDLYKLSSTNKRWHTTTTKVLDNRWKESGKTTSQHFPHSQSCMHTRNICREAFHIANSEANTSPSQRMNCLLHSLNSIDPRTITQMVVECSELRSLFCNPTSFLYNLLLDHSLKMVWDKLKEQNSQFNLPNFSTANGIRHWIETKEAKQIFFQIKALDLSRCDLLILPPEIGQLTALRELDIGENQLASFPPEIGQLTALKQLSLWRNQLTSLPPQIGQLAALKVLDIGENQLTSLPAEIGQLASLKQLNLMWNQLTFLPPEIGQLTALKQLFFRGNQLISLPPEVGQLIALQQLFLDKNRLTSLPPEIGQLAALKVLDIRGNPQLAPLPAEIIERLKHNQGLYLR